MFGKLKCKHCDSTNFKKISKNTYECASCGVQIRKKFVKIETEKEKKNNYKINDLQTETTERNENIDNKNFGLLKLLLCIFLGHFGVHRFIEGKIGTGLLFLFTYGLFGIGYICDIFRLATELGKSNKSGD